MRNYTYERVFNNDIKKIITKYILGSLPEWFDVFIGTEEYINNCVGKIFICAYYDEEPIGFLYLTQTGRDTIEISVIGVLKEYHGMGVGSSLLQEAKKIAIKRGVTFMQVKTIKMGVHDDYDKTNMFYLAKGFKEFEVFPSIWDETNPCQIYIMNV